MDLGLQRGDGRVLATRYRWRRELGVPLPQALLTDPQRPGRRRERVPAGGYLADDILLNSWVNTRRFRDSSVFKEPLAQISLGEYHARPAGIRNFWTIAMCGHPVQHGRLACGNVSKNSCRNIDDNLVS